MKTNLIMVCVLGQKNLWWTFVICTAGKWQAHPFTAIAMFNFFLVVFPVHILQISTFRTCTSTHLRQSRFCRLINCIVNVAKTMYCLIYVDIYSITCFAYVVNKVTQISHNLFKYVTEHFYSTLVTGVNDVRVYRAQ